MRVAVPEARRVWTLAKIWGVIKDVPENAILAAVVTPTVAACFYMGYRSYFQNPGESVPSIEMRHSFEKQAGSHDHLHVRPSIWQKIGNLKVDEQGPNIGVFPNRVRPFEGEIVHAPGPRIPNLPTEGPYPTEY